MHVGLGLPMTERARIVATHPLHTEPNMNATQTDPRKLAVVTFDDCSGPWSKQTHSVPVFAHNGQGFTQADLDSGNGATWTLNDDGTATLLHFGAGPDDCTRWGAENARWIR